MTNKDETVAGEHLFIGDMRRHPRAEVRLYVDGRLISGTFAEQVTASIDALRATSARSKAVWPGIPRTPDARQA